MELYLLLCSRKDNNHALETQPQEWPSFLTSLQLERGSGLDIKNKIGDVVHIAWLKW